MQRKSSGPSGLRRGGEHCFVLCRPSATLNSVFGTLSGQDEALLPERVCSDSWHKGSRRLIGPQKLVDNPQGKLLALKALPCSGAQPAWSIYGVEVGESYGWVTEAKNMGRWYLGSRKRRKSSRTRCDAEKARVRPPSQIEGCSVEIHPPGSCHR